MEQMEKLPASFRARAGSSGRAAAADIDSITIARTAIASGALALAVGLIGVTSAATLRIGPFNMAGANVMPSPLIRSDLYPRPHSLRSTLGMPIDPTMLIAQDPGDDAWQSLLTGEAASSSGRPIAVTAIGAMQPLRVLPAISYRTMEGQIAWMKLSAIRQIGSWGTVIVGAAGLQPSLFSKAIDPRTTADGAPALNPANNSSSENPPASAEGSQSSPAATKTQPDSPPAAPANTITPPPAPPAVTTPQLPPPVLLPPPSQTGGTRPPSNPGSGLSSPVAAVPEPTSWIGFVLGFGLIGVGLRKRPGRAAPTGR